MLSECNYRVELTAPGKFFCRHTQVHSRDNIVTSQFCDGCTSRTVNCTHPRAIPANRDVPDSKGPTILQMAWNAASSIAAFAADAMHLVDKQTYSARLAICDVCDQRSGTRCLNCGCTLALKATARAFHCPLGKWPNDETVSQYQTATTPVE